MEASAGEPASVLVVANRTAATPSLIDAVRDRAGQGSSRFTLLVPATSHGLHRAADPEDQGREDAESVIELATPLLEEAARGPIETIVGSHEALAAIEDAVNTERFDEIILSTLPTRVSRWLHLDLPSKVEGLGLPVTTVVARGRAAGG